jgi:hypothetical protein
MRPLPDNLFEKTRNETACELIICALNQPEFQESPQSQAIIEDFHLASLVKAELAGHDQTKGLELEVKSEKGIVRITGSIQTGGIFSNRRRSICTLSPLLGFPPFAGM